MQASADVPTPLWFLPRNFLVDDPRVIFSRVPAGMLSYIMDKQWEGLTTADT
jgi:hypothetical protein